MQRRSLVVQAWMNPEGDLEGQLSDPLTGWQQSFSGPDDLWRALTRVLGAIHPPLLSPDADSEPKE